MEAQTLTAREARQRLDETRHRNAPFEEKAREALELGEQYLGTDSAHLTRVDTETDHWETTVSTDTQHEQFPEGLELDLQTTYCRQTIEADGQVTLHDAPAQGWDDDPAFEAHGLHCYHGTTVYLDGEPYGTLCFVADDARSEAFETDETLFADLVRRLLEQELERQHHEAELTRRTNLVNVLNRVLRHNLRNDMTVIRGRTQIMAEQLGDSPSAATALNKIDDLIQLCEKAREVEDIVDRDHDRRGTDLETMIQNAVADVSDEFPAASITLEADADVTANVSPTFERAMKEIVENAAKHGGESPLVTITVEQNSRTVEVGVADTGPGLSEQELEVLKTGVETPLIHGSGLGLWLVHWIVANHGGTVDATVTDSGTIMTASVPRLPATDGTQDLVDLTQARNQYQAAFEESFDAQLLLDDEAHIIEANPAAERIFDLEQAEFRGLSLAEFYPEAFDFDACWSAFLNEGRNRDINTLSGPNGESRQVEYSAVADVVPGQHLFVARDVTERKEREKEIQEREAKYRSLFEDSRNALMLLDRDGFFDCNERCLDLFGFDSVDAFVSQAPWNVSPARQPDGTESEQRAKRHVETAFETGEALFDWVHERRDGTEFQAEVKLSRYSHHGEPAIHAVVRDISEWKEREQELETYETVLNSISDPAWVYDERKRVTFANQSNLDGLAISNEQLVGLPLSAFESHFADRETFDRWDTLVEDVLAGTVAEGDLDVTFDVQDDPLVMNLRVTPVPDSDDPTGAAVIASDITERKQRERVLEGYETIHQKDSTANDRAGVRVLHVDDGPHVTELVADMLERENSQFTVETATSPSEGLERIRDRPPDCVVSDYKMPGMDGIEFLEAVREEYPDLPFILYTSKGSEAVASDAIAADATDYLQKESGSEQYELLANRIENTVEHSNAEQQVTTTQRRLRELSEVTHDIHWMVTADWSEFLFVNSAYSDVFGRSRDELLENPMAFMQGVHPADQEQVTTEMNRASNGESVDFEFRINTDEDVQQWVWVQAEPIYDETAEPSRIAGFVRDVTERKERERTLEQTESIVQEMNDGAVIVQDGIIKFANSSLLELGGYAEDETAEMPMEEFIAPDYRETVEKRHRARIASNDTDLPDQYELKLLSDDGQRIPVEISTSRIEYQGQPATLSIVRDITERKRRQQQLDVERNRANALFEQLGEPTVEVEFDNGTPVIDTVNGAFEQTFCVEETRLVGEDLNEVLVPEASRSTARKITDQAKAGEVVEEELELPTGAGGRTFLLRTVPYSLDGSQRAYGIYFDVTDRNRREERFQAFIEQSTDIIAVLDPDGTYQYMSPSAGRMLGYAADELIGDDVFELVHPDDRERVMATFSEALSNPDITATAEYRFRHGDGSWIWLESFGNNQLENHAIEGFVVNSRDISERKERERRIQRERDRLDKFAGIVSHDLRNPLNVAQLRLELAAQDCESEHLDIVERAHGRMEQLIEDVLSLARSGGAIGETDVVDLTAIVGNCWQNVETDAAELLVETEASILADENQLKQLLENLLRNAVEHGGDAVTITIGDVPEGFYVEDNGPGIPDDERAEVLDPGYSTSEDGTGFGLTIVRDVAEAHGWNLAVTEGSAGGARFELSEIQMD